MRPLEGTAGPVKQAQLVLNGGGQGLAGISRRDPGMGEGFLELLIDFLHSTNSHGCLLTLYRSPAKLTGQLGRC